MIVLKINTAIAGFKPNDTIKLKTDKNNNIVDNFWYRRLKDAEIDGCVEIVLSKDTNLKEQKNKKGNK
jgi:hypothetical protein